MTDPPVQLADQGHQGDNEGTPHQIADAVGDVGGKEAELPPDQGLLKGKSHESHLGGDPPKAEAEAVESADQSVDDGGEPLGHFFRQEHDHAPEDGPDVEVGEPPRAHALGKPDEQDVDVDGKQSLPAVQNRQHHDHHTHQMDVGDDVHEEIGDHHESSQHAKDGDLVDGQQGLFTAADPGGLTLLLG